MKQFLLVSRLMILNRFVLSGSTSSCKQTGNKVSHGMNSQSSAKLFVCSCSISHYNNCTSLVLKITKIYIYRFILLFGQDIIEMFFKTDSCHFSSVIFSLNDFTLYQKGLKSGQLFVRQMCPQKVKEMVIEKNYIMYCLSQKPVDVCSLQVYS